MPDSVSRLLFEDLTLLLIAEVIAIAIALAFHRQRLTPASRRGVFLTLVACGAFTAVQFMVVTNREAVTRLVKTLVDAVDRGDLNAIETCLDDEQIEVGTGSNLKSYDKQTFVYATSLGLQTYQIEEARTSGFRIQIAGSEATVDFRVSCDIRRGQGLGGRRPNFWTLHCVRRSEVWKIDHIVSGKLGVEDLGNPLDLMPFVMSLCSRVEARLDR